MFYIVVSIKLGSDDAEQDVGGTRSFVLLLLLQIIEGLEGVVQLQLNAVVLCGQVLDLALIGVTLVLQLLNLALKVLCLDVHLAQPVRVEKEKEERYYTLVYKDSTRNDDEFNGEHMLVQRH